VKGPAANATPNGDDSGIVDPGTPNGLLVFLGGEALFTMENGFSAAAVPYTLVAVDSTAFGNRLPTCNAADSDFGDDGAIEAVIGT
jgi:hypothetical protein